MKTIIFYDDKTSETFEGDQNPHEICAIQSITLVVVYNDDNEIVNCYNPNDTDTFLF
jgi:hypothetical protein